MLKPLNDGGYLWKECGPIGNYTRDSVQLKGFIGPLSVSISVSIRNNFFCDPGFKRLPRSGTHVSWCPRRTDLTLKKCEISLGKERIVGWWSDSSSKNACVASVRP
jgi:hypothetical protein